MDKMVEENSALSSKNVIRVCLSFENDCLFCYSEKDIQIYNIIHPRSHPFLFP